jgi:hypothetical protein
VKVFTFAIPMRGAVRQPGGLPMTDNQDTYTTAPLWLALLGLIIAIEIRALPVTRVMLAAVLP